jgi:hypothetical protein
MAAIRRAEVLVYRVAPETGLDLAREDGSVNALELSIARFAASPLVTTGLAGAGAIRECLDRSAS